MTRDRVRRAHRMAAVAAFREERERQTLAKARDAVIRAEDEARVTGARLAALHRLREAAMTGQADVDAWLRYAALEDLADVDHASATAQVGYASDDASLAMTAWVAIKAVLDASEDRAAGIDDAYRADIERRDAADGLDRWLAHERTL